MERCGVENPGPAEAAFVKSSVAGEKLGHVLTSCIFSGR
jgi:hypothetical protein